MPRVAAGWHSHLEGLIAALRSEKLPEFEPLFTELLKKYTGILAGVVVSAAISPSITSATDQAYKALSDSRQQLLMQYDKTWKAADELENQVDELKHEVHADRKHTNADLDRTLKRTYDDLLRIEQDMRDLNKSAVK
jgi:septal ring factor EnvC (AmiA/AmiB activator)